MRCSVVPARVIARRASASDSLTANGARDGQAYPHRTPIDLNDQAHCGVHTLGRRDPEHVRVGDAMDFWRVEAVRRPELLRLRTEMKAPGRAWLQYEVTEAAAGSPLTQLTQTAFFEPKGLSGLLYWYLLLPVHSLVFRGSMRELVRRAERAERPRARRSRSGADGSDGIGKG